MLCVVPAPVTHADGSRIVRSSEVTLAAQSATGKAGSTRRDFRQRDMEGWINAAGEWHFSGLVSHGRLRCGVYEVGIQLGRGARGCLQTEWLTPSQFATRRRQCNSATVNHSGDGTLEVSPEQVGTATCVRVLVRCSGTCG